MAGVHQGKQQQARRAEKGTPRWETIGYYMGFSPLPQHWVEVETNELGYFLRCLLSQRWWEEALDTAGSFHFLFLSSL